MATRELELKQLFDEWERKYNSPGDYFVRDGIVNHSDWNDIQKKKILFVLKEAYDEKKKDII